MALGCGLCKWRQRILTCTPSSSSVWELAEVTWQGIFSLSRETAPSPLSWRGWKEEEEATHQSAESLKGYALRAFGHCREHIPSSRL